MKKTLFIVGGIILLLGALAAWLYLMFVGTPESVGDVFTDFGFTITTDRDVTVVPPEIQEIPDTTVDTTGEALRQLTTRPIAGFVVLVSTSTQLIRYAEQGTGYIYEINMASGEEERISGTTIPRVTSAVFDATGTYVALQSTQGNILDTFVGEIIIDEDKIVGTNLPPNAENVSLADGQALYTRANAAGSVGYSYQIADGSQQVRFSIPFKDVTVAWEGTTIHLYNDYTRWLEGTLYEITPNLSLNSLVTGGFGFLALMKNDEIVYTKIRDNTQATLRYNLTTSETTSVPILAIPEKCSFDDNLETILWCASEFDTSSLDYIEDWYKGAFSASDYIWRVDLTAGEATLIEDLSGTAGRQIDVSGLSMENNALFFKNKIDNTLWSYDLATN